MDFPNSTLVQRCESFLKDLPEACLRDEADLDQAAALVDEFIDHHPPGERPDVANNVLLALALVIEAYEDIHYPMGDQLEGANDAIP